VAASTRSASRSAANSAARSAAKPTHSGVTVEAYQLEPLRQALSSPRANLVNVAVSRAKRRLYVIGNRSLWSPCRYFDILANRLPHTPPTQP
jgi:hypothetical protein